MIDLLKKSLKNNASDLHLSSGMPPVLRINGDLIVLKDEKILSSDEIKNMLFAIIQQKNINKFNDEKQVDFTLTIDNLASFRINIFQQKNNVSAAFRIIPDNIPTLDDLFFPRNLNKLFSLSNGLILVAGATGSGKTTTLAAMINHINMHKAAHIITIEDPIEFIHHNKLSLIQQREVSRDTLSFSSALHAALRQDPDIILIGELRDLETIRLALTAAETGHLVFATLHSSSAPKAVSRIIDVFPAAEKCQIRNMLAESLQAVIYQELLKKAFGGQIAAFEVMLGTPAIRHLIREDQAAQMYSVIQTGHEAGMCTLMQSLQQLVLKGVVKDG